MEQLLQVLRFGVRILCKSPGLSATAVNPSRVDPLVTLRHE
jgi:hypothetical protein